jgi:putative pyruvate formate lyase activating enzyme
MIHKWEEPPISGKRGSGTLFFTHCNMRCLFCQNHSISQGGFGMEITGRRFRSICMRLFDEGAHNINLVTPTIYTEVLIPELRLLKQERELTIVWNSNGFERTETLRRLEGVVDVYLPDLKYADDEIALKYSLVAKYPEYAKSAIHEMARQVQENQYDSDGILRKGMIVRHLIIPGEKANSLAVLEWIRASLGIRFPVSLMSQYTPFHMAHLYPNLMRRLSQAEYEKIIDHAAELGLDGFTQDIDSASSDYTPDFNLNGL